MIDVIIESRPIDAQTILGTVSLRVREIDDSSILYFTEKLSILQAENFEEVLGTMQPYMDQMTL